LGSFEIDKEMTKTMRRKFPNKILSIWFLLLAGCSNQNAIAVTQQLPNEIAPTIQYNLTVMPAQIITNQAHNNTEKAPPPTSSSALNIPTSNQKFLIIDQRNYYISSLDGKDTTLLFSGKEAPIEMASLSPDETQLAYFKDNFVYIQNIADQKTITLNKEILGSIGGNLRWSPDGKKLFISCANAQRPSMAVCTIDTSNGQVEVPINETNTDEICHTNNNSIIEFQDLNSDGTKITFFCFIVTEQGQRAPFAVFIYDTISKTSVKILDSQTQGVVWEFLSVLMSPDGNSLLINSGDQNHIINVYLMDLITGAIKQLTKDTAYSFQATVWGSDSRSFYIHRISIDQPYTEENFLMDMNGAIISPIDIQGIISR